MAAPSCEPGLGQPAWCVWRAANPCHPPECGHRLAVPRARRARRPRRRRRRLGRLELRGRLAAELPRDHRLHHRDHARRGAGAAAPGTGGAGPTHDRLGVVHPVARWRVSRALRRTRQPPCDLQHRPDHARHGGWLYAAAARRLPGRRRARRPLAGRPAGRGRLLAQVRAPRHAARLQHPRHVAAACHRPHRRRDPAGGCGKAKPRLGVDPADRQRLVRHQRLRAMPSAVSSSPACCSARSAI